MRKRKFLEERGSQRKPEEARGERKGCLKGRGKRKPEEARGS